MKKLVLLRHGLSQWNNENRFTGWVDVPLSDVGMEEARNAGKLLKEAGFEFDVAYTSVLKRAIKTLWIALEELDMMWIPVHRSWRLNERMYGGLQGLNKAETAARHGDKQVLTWRRSYDVPPPPLEESSQYWPGKDRRYAKLAPGELPATAHGNSLRALVKYLDNVSDDDIVELNIPTGIPLVYELDDNLKPIKPRYYLGDPEAAEKAAKAVANQGKA